MLFTIGLFFTLILFSISGLAQNTGHSIPRFSKAKKELWQIHKDQPYTIYCPCKFQDRKVNLKTCGYKSRKDKKRAQVVEWEHVVPAEAFGQSFSEWREGSPRCIKKGKSYKGRKCASKNNEFSRMESDMYNLWPAIGELNMLRSNYSMAQIEGPSEYDFGDCKAKISDRKFEPMDLDKGKVARVYMYMNQAYPGRGIISDKNQKLFEAWDKLYPVDSFECTRAQRIEKIQGNKNKILEARCSQKKS